VIEAQNSLPRMALTRAETLQLETLTSPPGWTPEILGKWIQCSIATASSTRPTSVRPREAAAAAADASDRASRWPGSSAGAGVGSVRRRAHGRQSLSALSVSLGPAAGRRTRGFWGRSTTRLHAQTPPSGLDPEEPRLPHQCRQGRGPRSSRPKPTPEVLHMPQ
jgi:hypothetical protein